MTEPETILVVEDDRALSVGLDLNLSAEGYRVLVARDGARGLALALEERPDLIVLDLLLPNLDGYEVLERLRARGHDTPVIILSARGEEQDKVKGLKVGADDYVTKPFGLAELLARIEAALRRRRHVREDGNWVRFGRVAMERNGRQVWRESVPVALTAREYELLDYFASHPGRTVSRERLLEVVWGYDYDGTVRTIDNFVRSLRVKLEEDPAKPRHLVTVHGVGYRFDF